MPYNPKEVLELLSLRPGGPVPCTYHRLPSRQEALYIAMAWKQSY